MSGLPGADERWTEVDGRPVRSLALGRGPELVVVPGLGALGYLSPVLLRLATTVRVTLLDLPGFGRRTTADLPASLEEVARAAAGWLRAADLGPVVLAGHSTGAQAALRAALLEPDRVRALLLGGPTFPPRLRTLPPLAAAVLRTLVHESPAELPAVAPDYARGGRRLVDLLRTAMADRPEDAVGRVRVPVAVVRGRHDHVSPADWCARLAPGRVRTVPGAHNATWTHPVATADAWQDALPSQDGRTVWC
jgi:pimeloyl-ACP methyl ester carboxylesterase